MLEIEQWTFGSIEQMVLKSIFYEEGFFSITNYLLKNGPFLCL